MSGGWSRYTRGSQGEFPQWGCFAFLAVPFILLGIFDWFA